MLLGFERGGKGIPPPNKVFGVLPNAILAGTTIPAAVRSSQKRIMRFMVKRKADLIILRVSFLWAVSLILALQPASGVSGKVITL